MTDKEINSIYKANYFKVLDVMKMAKLSKHNTFEDLAKDFDDYREWVMSVAGIDSLPELPKE